MHFCLAISLVSCWTVGAVVSQSMPSAGLQGTSLDASGNFGIRWTFNATHIDLEMSARTLGWLAVGISPNGGMDQSDVLLGWVDDNTGNAVVQDRWNNAPPTTSGVNLLLDSQQDWNLVSGTQDASRTTIRATRQLVTCDPQDRFITTDTLWLIYATSPFDPRSPQSISMHTVRGAKGVALLSNAAASSVMAMEQSCASG